nr:glycosyltransferase [Gordonia sp. NB41Y]
MVDHNDALRTELDARLAGDDRATVVANTGTRGLSGARNTGVANATQDVVVFLDDDAVLSPRRTGRRPRRLHRHRRPGDRRSGGPGMGLRCRTAVVPRRVRLGGGLRLSRYRGRRRRHPQSDRGRHGGAPRRTGEDRRVHRPARARRRPARRLRGDPDGDRVAPHLPRRAHPAYHRPRRRPHRVAVTGDAALLHLPLSPRRQVQGHPAPDRRLRRCLLRGGHLSGADHRLRRRPLPRSAGSW